MIKEAQGTTGRQAHAAAVVPNFGALVEFNERAFEGLMQAGAAMIKGMAALSEEMFSFAQTRLHEDMDTYQALMHRCSSPGEVYDCQRRFAETATSQYLGIANRLTSLASRIAGPAWPPLQEGMGVVTGRTKLRSP